MRTLYLEKMDKPKFKLFGSKIEQDSFKIYMNLDKEKNIEPKSEEVS